MDRRAAKDLLHIQGWIQRVDEIVQRGKNAYLADILLQEAGDSLMMKLGEAANASPGLASSHLKASIGHSPSQTATSSFTSTTRSTEQSPGRPYPSTFPSGGIPSCNCSLTRTPNSPMKPMKPMRRYDRRTCERAPHSPGITEGALRGRTPAADAAFADESCGVLR